MIIYDQLILIICLFNFEKIQCENINIKDLVNKWLFSNFVLIGLNLSCANVFFLLFVYLI